MTLPHRESIRTGLSGRPIVSTNRDSPFSDSRLGGRSACGTASRGPVAGRCSAVRRDASAVEVSAPKKPEPRYLRSRNSATRSVRVASMISSELFAHISIFGRLPSVLCFSIQATASALNRPGVARTSTAIGGGSHANRRALGEWVNDRAQTVAGAPRVLGRPVRNDGYVPGERLRRVARCPVVAYIAITDLFRIRKGWRHDHQRTGT